MGNNQSNTSTMSTVNDIISKNITNVVNNTINTTNQNCSGTQDVSVTFGPNSVTTTNCPVKIGQSMSIDCKTQSYFQQQNDQTLQTQVNTALDNSLNSNQSNESASLTLVPYNQQSSTNIQNLNNYIKNIVEKNLTSNVTNQCLAIAKGAQNGNFVFNGTCNGPITFTQDMLIKQYSDCIASSVNQILTNDSNIQKLANTTTSSQSNTVSSVGAIVAVIVIAIVLIGIGYFAFKAFQSSPQGTTMKFLGATVSK